MRQGVGVLDEVMEQTRVREQLDCVEAFLDRVPDIDCTSGPMPALASPLSLPESSLIAGYPGNPASLASPITGPSLGLPAQQRPPHDDWDSQGGS